MEENIATNIAECLKKGILVSPSLISDDFYDDLYLQASFIYETESRYSHDDEVAVKRYLYKTSIKVLSNSGLQNVNLQFKEVQLLGGNHLALILYHKQNNTEVNTKRRSPHFAPPTTSEQVLVVKESGVPAKTKKPEINC